MISLPFIVKTLEDPRTILAGVVLGFLSGFFLKGFSLALAPVGTIYIYLMSMCLLPIIVTAMIWGIGQMLRDPATRPLFGRLGLVYALGFIITVAVAIVVALAIGPGAALSDEAVAALGKAASGVAPPGQSGGIVSLFEALIPANVFEALSTGDYVSVVVFCALAGLAFGVVRSAGADEGLRVIHAFYETFSTLYRWVLVPLAPGLFCIIASTMAKVNTELLATLVDFIVTVWVAGVLVILVHIVLLAGLYRMAPWRPFMALKRPLLLAFATQNPLVAVYSAIEALREDFGIDKKVAGTVIPFGLIANQHGQVVLLAVVCIFLGQIYEIEFSLPLILTIGFGAILAGAAALSGGPLLVPIIAPVLLNAGIPGVLSFVVLVITQPVVANLGAAITLQATCSLAVLTSGNRSIARPDHDEGKSDVAPK